MSKLYKGQFFRISVSTGLDLTGATSLVIKSTDPDGVKTDWPATIDPTDSTKMYYDCQGLSKSGLWNVYAKATFQSGSIPGDVTSFTIYDEGSI